MSENVDSASGPPTSGTTPADLPAIEVSRRCIGAGMCTAVAPDHFEFTAHGRAEVVDRSTWSNHDIAQVETAAGACPAAAITVTCSPTPPNPHPAQM